MKSNRTFRKNGTVPFGDSPYFSIISVLIILILCVPAFAADQSAEFYPAKVRDISDRAYGPAIIQLLDNAKESIVMSMYLIKPVENQPVYLLMRDLAEALDRGVSVEIYLNMRPDYGEPPNDLTLEAFQAIIKKGAHIYQVKTNRRLHDKLIIADSRYVVDGSMNWTVTAIKNNFESAVLIDSPELAKVKLIRLRNLPLEGREERPDRERGFELLPKDAIVDVSSELLNNKSYFPAMLKAQADRDMDMYLLLLAESARTGEKEFFIPLEDLAVTLGVSPEWPDTDMRRQMIKDLKALQDKYNLIEVNFSYGKDAWVELKDLPGGTFKVAGDFFDPKSLISKSQPAKVVLLINALLAAEGTSVDYVGVRSVAKRFGISQFSIRKGLREIGEKKGI